MVEGHEEKITVVDLDGTLVCGNTLHMYIRAAMRDAVRRRRYGFVARTMCALVLRRLKLLSHVAMKHKILPYIEVTDELRDDFVKRVSARRRHSVDAFIAAARAEGEIVVLATAAPAVYVPWIWGGMFVASPPDGAECRGVAKVAALRSAFPDFDQRLHTIVTDHHDDLPLLVMAAPNKVLVAPSSQTVMIARAAGIEFSVLDPR
jgi:phosphoserine phosphatase